MLKDAMRLEWPAMSTMFYDLNNGTMLPAIGLGASIVPRGNGKIKGNEQAVKQWQMYKYAMMAYDNVFFDMSTSYGLSEYVLGNVIQTTGMREKIYIGFKISNSEQREGLNFMNGIKKVLHGFLDLMEIYLPSILFLVLFITFVINIFFRYILGNPQIWTYEVSTVTFVMSGFLAASLAYRHDKHVVFDLFYQKLKIKNKNIIRIISGAISTVLFMGLIVPSIIFLYDMRIYKTSVLLIPFSIVFSVFPIFLVISSARSLYRLVMDVKSMKNKTYEKTYIIEEEN